MVVKSILIRSEVLPEDELEKYLSEVRLKRFTPRTLATHSSLRKDLDKIRLNGYGIDEGEGLEGIHCVSAVILDDYHYPVGAITVIAPSLRLECDRFHEIGESCVKSAREISEKLLS